MSWKDVDKKTIGKNKEKYCIHCKYSGALEATTKQYAAHVYCNYMEKAGHRRGCSPINCKKFEPAGGDK